MTNSSTREDLQPEKFHEIFLRATPLMDVRAPVEFAAGAFPGAINHPLLDDEQRHLVGTEYVQHGQQAAIELGSYLATDKIREQRLQSWIKFVTEHPHGYLYCFRGGLRSRITQQWLAEVGYKYPLISGGYKALRRFLLEQLTRLCDQGNIILVSGQTGVGKTELLHSQAAAIDLEGRANHRGSAFGRTFSPQPAQIDWENQIIVDWLRCEARSDAPVLIEAESHLIGRIHLPFILQQAMAEAPTLVLKASLQERIERLFADYVEHSLRHFEENSEDPWKALQANTLDNLSRIKKRLGGLRFQQLCELLPDAVRQLRDTGKPYGFHRLIEGLLSDYYDQLYRHTRERKQPRVVFEGSMSEISHWLAHQPVTAKQRAANL